ncbi:hypothetical protein [uncultured Marinobacter sp.]|uniref:hypothetical protein n=1 Tax=uncultured Marinobacter sp. TaxID=187379 RepID=UPI00259AD274|nr:hypothetical protein [uncultured Marinobacter sp.]
MTNSTPHDTQIGTDDVQLMVRLGVPAALIRILLNEAGLPIPDNLMPSDQAVPQGLSATEKAVLRSGGARGLDGKSAATEAEEHLMALKHLNECRELVKQSYKLEVVAERLRISPEATKACASGRTRDLYAFKLADNGQWLFPKWQFYELGRIPNLHSLLSAVGERVNPLVLSRFMLMKSIDLENDEECYSPRDWLIRGFEPEPVLRLVRDL